MVSMDKISSPKELQMELQNLLAYTQKLNPSRSKIAAKLEQLAEKVEESGQTLSSLIEEIRLNSLDMGDAALAYNQRPSQSNHKLDEIKNTTLKMIKISREILPLVEKLKKHKYTTY